MHQRTTCKFTPMEFETLKGIKMALSDMSVNLLRWSLKQKGELLILSGIKCKFTPMEFETKKVLQISLKWSFV